MGNKGKLGFSVILLCLSLSSCRAQQSGVEFYEGLKMRQAGAQPEAAACFEKALNADNSHIAAAAAAELMSLHSAGIDLSPTAMMGIREKAAGSWAGALDATEAPMQEPEKLLTLLLTGESRSSIDEAARYALWKWREAFPDDSAGGGFFTEAEHAAIDGRIAASRSRYSEALIFFRIVLDASPELFFRYPDLLTDLGRTFQYTGAGKEGMDLFLKWERIISDEDESPVALREAIPAGSGNLIRFRLLFFAARMARQRSPSLEGGNTSIELFERALPFAREIAPEQTGFAEADACIWYILDLSLAESPEKTIRYLETYSVQWHDDAYFFDVLDKLARELILKRQWENVSKVGKILQNHGGAARAQYAWITGRLIEEGLFSPEPSAGAYMRIACDAGSGVSRGAGVWYYRSLSAAALGEDFLTLAEAPPPEAAKPAKGRAAKAPALRYASKNSDAGDSEALQFIMGFFENNAVQFAPRYVSAVESGLSSGELQRIAGAFGAAGRCQESIRLVSLYINRSDYQLEKRDLELLFPRPFREPVERYAQETGIEPALLYGLIRTESAFNPDAVSRAGAVGLSQLMPATAEEMAGRIRRRGGPDYIQTGAIDLCDPAVNIHIGAVYLAYLNERMDDPLLAVLAYNGGMNRIRRWRTSVNRSAGSLPPDLFLETVEYAETRNYGRSVMGAAAMYRELYPASNP